VKNIAASMAAAMVLVSVENPALSLANTGLLPGPAGQLPSALICSSTPSGQVSANSLPR
jgi:hypothetical protein